MVARSSKGPAGASAWHEPICPSGASGGKPFPPFVGRSTGEMPPPILISKARLEKQVRSSMLGAVASSEHAACMHGALFMLMTWILTRADGSGTQCLVVISSSMLKNAFPIP